ncbi:MAG TPA: hypothetical protein VM621_13200 [Luteibacter sp.]|uniref:hypothetical protein n=1 Tax=Luteibacter sp. TaxID=1886636 RepID=UPI002BCBE5FF|nr:hypothetical protein [Luteibacter sp.]HVI55994.1 hypothetical protein [Luteibacter sp.]
MQVDGFAAHTSFGLTPARRFSRDHRSSLSLHVGSEAGLDIVAMVTVERVGGHIEWEALVWRGTAAWMEMRGTCADVPGVIEAQIRNRLAERPARPRLLASEKRVAGMIR